MNWFQYKTPSILESTQLMQRDRQKRKRQPGPTKQLGPEDKAPENSATAKTEEIKEQVNISRKETRRNPELKELAREQERSNRSYLRHTKTSRLRSVNKRDEDIKERIKNESNNKFQTQVVQKNSRECLPPSSNVIVNGTTPVNMNQIKRISPRRKPDDNIIRGSANFSSGMFKLEGKARAINNRRGSKTNRDNSENVESKFRFARLQDKRAEKKNQKSSHILSNIASNRNSDILKKEPQFK